MAWPNKPVPYRSLGLQITFCTALVYGRTWVPVLYPGRYRLFHIFGGREIGKVLSYRRSTGKGMSCVSAPFSHKSSSLPIRTKFTYKYLVIESTNNKLAGCYYLVLKYLTTVKRINVPYLLVGTKYDPYLVYRT